MFPANIEVLCRLGDVMMTPRVRASVTDDDLTNALLRHARQTWGDVPTDGPVPGRRSTLDGCRVLTVNRTQAGIRFLILSEDLLNRTLVLLPEECRTLPFPDPGKPEPPRQKSCLTPLFSTAKHGMKMVKVSKVRDRE